jgi:uncharacterized protein YecT (DUF1311 family)
MKKKISCISCFFTFLLSSCLSTINTPTANNENKISNVATSTSTFEVLSTEMNTQTPTEERWSRKDFETADCWEKAQTQYDLNQCSGVQEQLAYQYMNELLDVLHQKLPPEDWQSLQEAQSSWETYRKSDCKFIMGLYRQGSMAPMMYESCLYQHDIERINDLNFILCEVLSIYDYCIIYN